MTSSQRRIFLEAIAEFFRCPNTGKVIEGMPHDDKVICYCGRSNPKVQEAVQGVVHHIKRFLEPASVDEYLAQEDGRERA